MRTRYLLVCFGILIQSAVTHAQDSLGVAYFPYQNMSIVFSQSSSDRLNGVHFVYHKLVRGDATSDYLSGSYTSFPVFGNFSKLQFSGDSVSLELDSSQAICTVIKSPSPWSANSSAIYVFDGTHTVIMGGSVCQQNGVIHIAGPVTETIDASFGSNLSYWMNNSNSGIPQSVWDSRMVKGDYNMKSTLNDGSVEINCSPSNNNCVYIIN